MAHLDAKDRFKGLEKYANDFTVDIKQPIRRYYRSGAEMVKMANTYMDEEIYEKAYILYLKYLTLFIEKIRIHPEFKSVAPGEKARVMKTVKLVMPKSEQLKQILLQQYDREHKKFQLELEIKLKQEEERRNQKVQQEGENLRKEISKYHDDKAKTLAIQRDMEVAMWHQLKINQEEQEELDKQKKLAGEGIHQPVPDRGAKPITPSAPAVPAIPDRSTKPSLSLYGTGTLRTVMVPSMLMATFESLAEPNTSKDVETCGLLAGKLAHNQFRITHLIVPKQTGTSDSCSFEGEGEIYDYHDAHDLISLGWIHTHPSYSAFLSSVDLHTHLPYQLLMPEAVAIVVSAKDNATGFFMLTTDYGLDYVSKCSQTDGFHYHPKEPPLFCDAKHVTVDHNEDVIVKDFRS